MDGPSVEAANDHPNGAQTNKRVHPKERRRKRMSQDARDEGQRGVRCWEEWAKRGSVKLTTASFSQPSLSNVFSACWFGGGNVVV